MFSFVKHWFCVKSLQDVTRNQTVFVGCSEIGVSVINKYVQHTEITRALCLPRGGLVKFFSAWGDRKNCWVLFIKAAINTQSETIITEGIFNQSQQYLLKIHT